MALSLAGKTAIVTGAGSGINLAFARSLLARQCNVVLADVALRPDAEDLVNKHSSRSKLSNGRAVFTKTDVRHWGDLEQMFEVASKEFSGAVDVVCPGAGVYEPTWSSFWHPPSSPLSKDSPTSNNYDSISINITHPIRTTQLAIQHYLRTRPRPSPSRSPEFPTPMNIVHISSIGHQISPFAPALYCAAKHAISSFARSLSPLHQRLGIRVTAVAPGVIRTPLWMDDPIKRQWLTEDDQLVTPETVADCMLDLASEEQIMVQGEGSEWFPGGRKYEIEGGMIVEVSAEGRRIVKQVMDPGPQKRAGNTFLGLTSGKSKRWFGVQIKTGNENYRPDIDPVHATRLDDAHKSSNNCSSCDEDLSPEGR
ncbi:uncharacterized protein KY384_000569 [Bacidia gigantensis]|uniref:uncharacterized protein n=1 Tax=Bacidia gigantensis TaxID=2732470 RepID=UPI001D056FA3|nr:uncharacterized protein KY384_000569 [Bacidia gigantensis]KAG8525809.1 hypothetical protein KY384_000569 [Bacidia gigantensis]